MGMYRCCVVGCCSKSGLPLTKDPTTFHTFPSLENPSLRNEWISAVGRTNWEPALTSRICSEHFTVEDFCWINTVKKLKKDAVPSVNVGLGGTLVTKKMSVKECVVPTCSSKYSESPFFNFPKDKAFCLKWLLAIPQGGWSLNQESQVCSRHFDKKDVVVSSDQAWLKSGSVPKLYLDSPTVVSKDSLPPVSKTEVTLSTPVGQNADKGNAETSTRPEEATQSASSKLEPVEVTEGVTKIRLDADGDSESDLEIIEPEIETYEVSDTSDEGEPPSKKIPDTKATPLAPKVTSLNCNLQINEVHSSSTRSNVIVKAPGSSTGRVIRGDSRIKCCVPRCGSEAGIPPGVGFHSFPQVGETRLSVRSLDNKLTVHDLFSMWKSLLSVPSITEDSYVCTRHFTPNDYTGNVLNKVAVPTQFLPTPVTFAPCKIQDKAPVQPPPLILLNKSKNPPPILRKPTKSGFNYGASSIRFPGIPSVNNVNSLTRVAKTGGASSRMTVGPLKTAQQMEQPKASQAKSLPNLAPKSLPSPLFPPAKRKLGCSITGCPNRASVEDNKIIMFRLPHNIDKCKEWVYSCGHPEWLDKGMISARSLFRICMLHFEDDMFLDASRKTLKGSAKPTVDVQEPYKKCIVKHCHNYYDKERLHYIGVDFATFPTESHVFSSWIKAVKGGPLKTTKVTEEDVKTFTGAVICSLHFRNSDYVAGSSGKSLSPSAVPSMNLALVKEPDVPLPRPPPSDDGNESAQQQIAISSVRSLANTPSSVLQPRLPTSPSLRPLRAPALLNKYPELGGTIPRRGRPPGPAYFSKRQYPEGYVPRRGRPPRNAPFSTSLPAGGAPQPDPEPNLPESTPPELSEPVLPKKGRPFGRRGGRGRGRRSQLQQSEVDSEDGSQGSVDEGATSTRRSSRIGALWPSGRPVRSAVLKRRSIVESDIESSDDEPLAKRLGRVTKPSSTEDNLDTCVRRNLRPRRAAARRSFKMDSSESEGDSRDVEWQEESEQGSAGFGDVATGGHFLDPILNVERNFEQSVDDVTMQPVGDESEVPDGDSSVRTAEDTPEQPAVDTPEQPAVDTPEQPALDTPEQPAVDTPEQHAVDTPEQPTVDTLEQPAVDIPGQHVLDSSEQPAVDTLEQPAADITEQPTVDIPEQPAVDTPEQPALDTLEQPAVDIPEQPAVDIPEQPALDTLEQPAVDTPEQPALDTSENETAEPSNKSIVDIQDVAVSSDVEGTSKELSEELSNQPSVTAADIAYKVDETGSKCNSGSEVCSLKTTLELSNPNKAEKESSTAEKPTTNGAVDNQNDALNTPSPADISDVPEKDCGMDIDEPDEQSGETLFTFGPQRPVPTLADLEFFRSIMPAVASFNRLQKAELRTTIVATLREMLDEQLDLGTEEPVKTESQIPHVEPGELTGL